MHRVKAQHSQWALQVPTRKEHVLPHRRLRDAAEAVLPLESAEKSQQKKGVSCKRTTEASYSASPGIGGLPAAKKRRYHGKPAPRAEDMQGQGADEDALGSDMEEDQFLVRTCHATETCDPRALEDLFTKELQELLLDQPTLPAMQQQYSEERSAARIPWAHCAFKNCHWSSEQPGPEDLADHVVLHHRNVLQPLADKLQAREATKITAGERATKASFCSRISKIWDAYRAALDWKCQHAAPLACTTIDRRCLSQYAANLEEDKAPTTAICFLCACRYIYIPYGNAEIKFYQALKPDDLGEVTFCGLSASSTDTLLGRQTYETNYIHNDAQTPLSAREEEMLTEIRDWTCKLEFPQGAVDIICCPEDKYCRHKCPEEHACSDCWIPVCKYCYSVMESQQLPAKALANDLVVYYAPPELYTENVTMLEMICASPCMTSIICFCMDKKNRGFRTMDERVHMQRFRQGARGSATTFLLDWEWLLNEFQNLETVAAANNTILLPRSGEELRKYVSVILKSRDKDVRAEDVKHLVHQATVRRHIVVRLIENGVHREHPAYKHVDLEAMMQRAESVLPENDVPAEVVALLESDEATELLYKQKNAAPIAEPDTVEDAVLEMNLQRPNGVVLEKSGCDVLDGEGQQEAALRALAADITPDELAEEDCEDAIAKQADESVPERQVVSSTTPMDQFAPCYFGVAFAFLFKYCTAMPDPPNYGKYKDKRWRRHAAAPRVTLQDWTRLMSQRVESQLNRDWTFGYTAWNILFRSAVNLSRSVYAYDTPVRDATGEWQTMTPTMLEDAACEIIQALKGSYRAPDGRSIPVQGNLNLVRFVPNISPTAQRILANLSHTARKVPGTQEARRIMRFEIQAMRIRYCTPIFVTVTPDEAHSLLYVRMSRHRRSDPIRRPEQHCNARSGDRRWPALDKDLTLECPVEIFAERRATWEERRRILARDPLATVHGFRVTMFLVMKHLFGMNVCLQCPSCNCGSMPCQDWQGSNATCAGGIFGRCDAAYVAIEFQKSSGSPHGHIQLFVQCLHQHETLVDIFNLAEERLAVLRADYLRYEVHVRRSIYGRSRKQTDEALQHAEQQWPEYVSVNEMCW